MGKVILYLGGGAMAGVFGAGIVTKLQDKNLYDKIKAVYGSSAGVFNMAYFLSKQTRLGSRIYWEDLTEKFISVSNGPLGIWERFWNSYVHKLPRRKILNEVNIDLIMDVAENKKILDINAIKKNPMPAYVKLYDVKQEKIVYQSIKSDTLRVIKDSVSVIPWYFPSRNQKFVDGGIVDGKGGYDYLRKKYPHDKIVICMNFRPEDHGVLSLIQNFFEGIVASIMYPQSNLFSRFLHKNRDLREEVERIASDPYALLICPPENNPSFASTVDPRKLKKTWFIGQKEAEKILEWMK